MALRLQREKIIIKRMIGKIKRVKRTLMLNRMIKLPMIMIAEMNISSGP